MFFLFAKYHGYEKIDPETGSHMGEFVLPTMAAWLAPLCGDPTRQAVAIPEDGPAQRLSVEASREPMVGILQMNNG